MGQFSIVGRKHGHHFFTKSSYDYFYLQMIFYSLTSLTGQHRCCHHIVYMWKEWSSGQLNSLLSLTIQYHDNKYLYSEVNSIINLDIESPKATITPTSSYETASDI